ncbi:MAG: hypothetical protein NC041_04855 [Bacteroides sp.]|nr:hypothetical protein [Prevotella sp.]MCM1407289.1 hypothetical protein [Treponema brennaborense]MCM1469777.1 hypothetical protein [Bacteroides sp.]
MNFAAFCGKRKIISAAALCFLCGCLFAQESAAASEKKTTTVVIKSAENTEYRHNKDDGVNTIVLTGDVCVSVEQGQTKTTIYADTVVYERERSKLYAQGNVKIQKESADANSETLTAQTVLFDTDTQEGVFDGGRVVQAQSDAINLPAGSAMIIASEEFGRSKSGAITFKNANLTFCDDPEPHWRIKSRRLWLLPGNEFSFLGGLLYVGSIPIAYIPFFYYPKDEMIFNPVFGYRKREGYFMQTTTYIIGRKPLDTADSEESFFDFLKTTQLKKQRREGLFLHNLNENDVESKSYMKIYADMYSSLGAMVGLSGVLNPKDLFVSNVEFVAAMGFSHTLTPKTSGGATAYTPYDANGDLRWDSSGLFGIELPFRYFMNFKASFKQSAFSGSLQLPLYSDYKFDADFMDRAETMDWLNFILENPAMVNTDETLPSNSVTSFTWSFTGSVNPGLKSLDPYISSLQISNFSSSMAFSSKSLSSSAASERGITSYSPEYYFYYPYQFTPLRATFQIAGTLFSYSSSGKKKKTKAETASEKSSVSFFPPADLAEESEEQTEAASRAETEDSAADEKKANAAQENGEASEIFGISHLPEIAVSVPSPQQMENVNYSLSYDITPAYTSLITYNGSSFESADDISLSKIQNLYHTVAVPINLTSSVKIKNSMFSMTNAFKFNPYWQDHPIMWMKEDKDKNVVDADGYYTYSSASSVRKNDYAARKMDLLNTNSVTYKPFANYPRFSNTSLSWNSSVKLLRSEFDSDAEDCAENPTWSYKTPDWGSIFDDKDSVTAHTFDVTLSSSGAKNYSQQLTLQANLPPEVDSYLGRIYFSFPFMTFSAQTKYKQTSETDSSWVFDPFTQNASWNFFSNKLKLTQSFSYNIEDDQAVSFKVGASWNGLQISYNMQYTKNYSFNPSSGWAVNEDGEQFHPYSLSVSYSMPSKKHVWWKKRIHFTPGLSTSIYADLVKPTNSYLVFEPSVKFTINQFLDISLSTSSRNSTIFKYVNDTVLADYDIPVSSETNFFVDLWNSFAFWDRNKRVQSAFKLKSFSLKAEHDLHDWNLSLEITMQPRTEYDSSAKKYEIRMDPYIALSVVWRPMSSMKTSIVDKYGDLQLNPD